MRLLNEGDWDRAARMLAGIVLLGLGVDQFAWGAPAVAMIAIGAILGVTGLVGWCPLYSVFRLSTRRRGA